MNIKRIDDVTALFDPADRADAAIEFIETHSGDIVEGDIIKLLKDPYDVVRANILDYMIIENILIDPSELSKAILREESSFVRGRLALCSAASEISDDVFFIALESLEPSSEYDSVWFVGSKYRKYRKFGDFWKLASHLLSRDPAVCGIALDISSRFCLGSHRTILLSVLTLVQQCRDHRIDPEKLDSETRMLRGESPNRYSLVQLRTQLWDQ